MEDILESLNESLKLYFTSRGFTSKSFYCRKCGKLLVDVDKLNQYEYSNIGKKGFPIKKYFFWITDENGRKLKSVDNEPEEFRWFLFGKILHGSNDRVLYRHTCWDCMYDDLHTVVDIRKVAVKNKWYRRIQDGERPIPNYNIVSSNYFKLIFDITDEELSLQKKQIATASLEKFIKKFGKEEGERRWEEYRFKQGNKNTKEYKMQVKGMTESEVDSYNRSRACTLKNFIALHGKEDGKRRWEEYCKRQAYAGNKLEYFIEKYGKDEGTKKYHEVCSQKVLSLKNFIRKYGQEEGVARYKEFITTSKFQGYSLVSQKLFQYIDDAYDEAKESSKWYTKNLEAEIKVVEQDEKIRTYKSDFLLGKKIIEFNGDFWHANPKIYDANDILRFGAKVRKAEEVWAQNKARNDAIQKLGYKIYVVWESDFYDDPSKVTADCVNFLKDEQE